MDIKTTTAVLIWLGFQADTHTDMLELSENSSQDKQVHAAKGVG